MKQIEIRFRYNCLLPSLDGLKWMDTSFNAEFENKFKYIL